MASSLALVVPNCSRIHTLLERVCHMSCPSIVLEVLQQCNLHGAQRAVLSTLAAFVDTYGPQVGLDHRVGHFRPLRIMDQVLEGLVLSIVRGFGIAQK